MLAETVVALTLMREAASEGETGMRLVAESIVNNARSERRSIARVARDNRLYSCWRRTTPEQAVKRVPHYSGANAKAWSTACRIAADVCRRDYRPLTAVRYYHDRRMTSQSFRKRFDAPLQLAFVGQHMTFYGVARKGKKK
jgi:hypothetical protein